MTTVPVSNLLCVCKKRSLPKEDQEMMNIANVEAMKAALRAVIAANPVDRVNEDQVARKILDQELGQYLSGLRLTMQFEPETMGMGDLGEEL